MARKGGGLWLWKPTHGRVVYSTADVWWSVLFQADNISVPRWDFANEVQTSDAAWYNMVGKTIGLSCSGLNCSAL